MRTGSGIASLRSERVLLVAGGATVALAAALRLWRLDLTMFERDEGALIRIAEDIVRSGQMPLTGPMFSQGVPSAPHFMYLLAPLIAVSRDPAFISGAIGLANVAGIGATLWLGWRGFGPLAGVIAALLYAASPWATFYARRIWQPDILAPLAAFLFVALDLAIVERRVWWAAITFPIAVLAVLVHPSFATLLPVLIVPAGVLIRTRRWRPLLLGAAVAALITLPTAVREVQTRLVDVANMRYYSSLHTWVDLEAVTDTLVLATGLSAPHDVTVPPFDHAIPGWLVQVGAGLETLLLVIALGVTIWLAVRARGALRLRLVGVLGWFLLPVVLEIRHTLPLHVHYFLHAYPAIFLIMGLAAAWLLSRAGKLSRIILATSLAAIVALQGVEITHGLNVATATSDACYGRPLNTEEAIEREIVDFGARTGATRAAMEFATDDALPRGYLARADFGAIDVAGVGAFGLGFAAGQPVARAVGEPVLTRSRHLDLVYANGIRLQEAAYAEQPRLDQRISLALDWSVPESATSIRPHVWDIALVNSAGQKVYEKSGVDHVPGTLSGQRIVSWFLIDAYQEDDHFLPPDTYQIQVRLEETWTPEMLVSTDPSGYQSDVFNLGAVDIGAPLRCRS